MQFIAAPGSGTSLRLHGTVCPAMVYASPRGPLPYTANQRLLPSRRLAGHQRSSNNSRHGSRGGPTVALFYDVVLYAGGNDRCRGITASSVRPSFERQRDLSLAGRETLESCEGRE